MARLNTNLALFDSGIGGFTVLNRIKERHKSFNYIYLADTARQPFGDKDSSQIRKIAKEIILWLNISKPSAIVVACNTTNSLAIDIVNDLSSCPVFELITTASLMLEEKNIGVIATPATVSSGEYSRQIKLSNPSSSVFEQSCPLLVPMIESGEISGSNINSILWKYLSPLIDKNVEAIVLGCTHYPLLMPVLRELLPPHVRIVDPAIGIANKIDEFADLSNFSKHSAPLDGNTRLCVTSDPIGFAKSSRSLLGHCPKVELVSLLSKACFL